MNKILVIQTAFIGDVILATGMIEKLAAHYPDAQIDFLVRKGNESLVLNNPHIHELLIWNKKEGKYKSLFKLLGKIRNSRYDAVVNLQRFGATGLLTGLSNAREKIGFEKNPFSFLFTQKLPHEIGNGTHEIERNHELIRSFTDNVPAKPKLYPAPSDFDKVATYKGKPYVVMAPTSVWYTKQYPAEKWTELIDAIPKHFNIFLIGGPPDKQACQNIIDKASRPALNLAGELHFLASAALMQDAEMNYVNDSGPMHIASSVDAPTTAIFCSTIPNFGFGPLASTNYVVEVQDKLECRPCGLHGHKGCPQKHFNCGKFIETKQLLSTLPN